MAIAHNIHRASGLDSEITPRGRDGVCSDDVIDEFQAHSLESQGTDISEVDSGMGSDDYDLLELGEASSDYCRVGSQCCLIPFELYDLPDLSSILSVETWNDCLTEEERFALTEYLPDMEQEMFSLTIRELLSGGNFHFGRPLHGLFEKLKGGLCEPKVDLYCRCMNFLQMRKHYHHLHEYQKCMVDSLVCMRNAWENYSGYGVEERLRHLNMLKSQRALGYTKNKRPKVGQWDINPMKPSLGMQSSTAFVASEQIRKGESYPRGILKVSHMNASSRREFTGPPSRFFSLSQELEPDCRPLPSPLPHPSQDPVTGFELKSTGTSRSLKRDADVGVECGMAIQPGRRVAISRLKKRSMKVEHLKRNVQHAIAEEDREGNSYDQCSLDPPMKDMHAEWNGLLMLEGGQIDCQGGRKPRKNRVQDGGVGMNAVWTIGTKKRKAGQGQKIMAGPSPAPNYGLYSQSGHNVGRKLLKLRGKQSENGAHECIRGSGVPAQNEETESDSSEKGERDNISLNKLKHLGHANGMVEKNNKKIQKGYDQHLDQENSPGTPSFQSKGKKIRSRGTKLKGNTSKSFSTSTKLPGSQKSNYKWTKKGKIHDGHRDDLPLPVSKVKPAKQKNKALADPVDKLPREDYLQDYAGGMLDAEKDRAENTDRAENKDQVTEVVGSEFYQHAKRNTVIMGCDSVKKGLKGKKAAKHTDVLEDCDYTQSRTKRKIRHPNVTRKANKEVSQSGSLSSVTPDPNMWERESTDVEAELSATPTAHTGLSFSITHLLSSIRKSMITFNSEEATHIVNGAKNNDEKHGPAVADSGARAFHSFDYLEGCSSDGRNKLSSLTVREIVNYVRANPGDPCILEMQEPLEDLVRGVLKILASKTAPLGAKGWEALVVYEKSTKSWSWIGSNFVLRIDLGAAEEETSSEAWGIPQKTLVKLVDAFANWLKSKQEVLKKIANLPPPPIMMLPYLDEKERFRDLRAQKSLVTINPSSDEVRAFFQAEEILRYSIPDKAFSYTAIDGRKSIVAPLRRGSGKPISKARGHFMLKPDRPPHITVLCLVRDAAARLPGSIGTRLDICTLIRDSQYLVEHVSDAQVNSVVSGALDRLHYEQDPCVQFDGDRKLWVYLHGDREEEDFEDLGTSSMKKAKWTRKDSREHAGTRMTTDGSFSDIGDLDAVDS
ncbi:unnamed protein product [Spirodela intermedia]|uniref:DEUBAD domain-containing protein n=1 Tax=Spirodela intermedia TaxID=51605 RepID=A0A7I8JZQ3_SPIIN|nr:unnamed protein product [Spirodela intermedia]